MRRSREETARTRERIIEAASEEFREHGIVGIGLAELMKAAGLTHGGFYKHFTSKDEISPRGRRRLDWQKYGDDAG